VRCHSAYRVPVDYTPREKRFADLLRDADKIDIVKVNVIVPIEEIYNVTTYELTHCSVTEEVLQALEGGAMGLLVELKPESGNGAALAAAVMELIERYGFGERSMFMSLDYTCLMPLMEKHPEWWTGFCLFGTSGDIDENIWRYDVDFLAVEEALVSGRLVLQAREQSLPVYVWSVYDDERMRQYLEMGVSGIITDYPEDLRAVLDTYNALHPTGVIQEGKWFPIQEDGEIPVS
jgi:glycerophosphoryl diester phosphodiesterase